MAKDQICCGRLKGRLVHEQGNLARLARAAAVRKGKGLQIDQQHLDEMGQAKVAVAMCKKAMEDHDAEHAGTPESMAS